MLEPLAFFRGTPAERGDLVRACARNCACRRGQLGAVIVACGAHAAYAHDQRFLDGVLAYRHMATRLRREEFAGDEPGPLPRVRFHGAVLQWT